MTTFIDELEDIIDTVSDWCVDVVNQAVSTLAPDGRPFMTETKSESEQLQLYMSFINSPDPQAMLASYIVAKASEIANKLAASNISPDKILSVHPYDIAARHVIIWSAKMEDLLRKRNIVPITPTVTIGPSNGYSGNGYTSPIAS